MQKKILIPVIIWAYRVLKFIFDGHVKDLELRSEDAKDYKALMQPYSTFENSPKKLVNRTVRTIWDDRKSMKIENG